MSEIWNLANSNQRNVELLPGHLGIVVVEMGPGLARLEMPIQTFHKAPNGYLHAGSVIALADSCAGHGCMSSLPDGAASFTTVESKTNHLGTALEGTVDCIAQADHLGRTTQVWSAKVSHRESGQTLALFRCTQMIIYPRPPR